MGAALATTSWGGWYSYRASKAALNRLVKTASIEVARPHPQAVLVALHPGTVNSALSAPFNDAEIGRPAADGAGDMLRVLDGVPVEETGGFYAYSGGRTALAAALMRPGGYCFDTACARLLSAGVRFGLGWF